MIVESGQLDLFVSGSTPEKCTDCRRKESCYLTSEQRKGWNCRGNIYNKHYPDSNLGRLKIDI